MRLAFFLSGFLSLLCSGYGSDSQLLKHKEPNWRSDVIEVFEEGTPSRVVFYEPINRGIERPVKQIVYYQSGGIKEEMDLTLVEETEAGAIAWKTPIVPHGVAISFFTSGQVERISHYHLGLLDGEVKVFYPTGKLNRELHYKKGVLEGVATSFYEEEKRMEVVEYREGKRVGDHVRYYPNGERAALTPHVAGLVHGVALEWHENGTIKSTHRWKNGALQSEGGNPAIMIYNAQRMVIEVQDMEQGRPAGAHLKYHPNGKVSYKANYVEGKKQGKEQFFSSEGALIGEGEYVAGLPIGTHWRNHPNGKQEYLAKYDPRGNLTTPILKFNEQGTLIARYRIVDEKYEGAYEEWHEDGAPSIQHQYLAGQLEGVQCEYFPNGRLKMRTYFASHKREGLYEEWYVNGQIALQVHYREGERDGLCLAYFEDGTKKMEGSFVKGQFDQIHRKWHANGRLFFEGAFALNKKEGLHRSWNEEGILLMEATYQSDRPDGIVTTYYGKEQPKEIIRFRLGKKEGKSELFYPSGHLQLEISYLDDLPDGEMKRWYDGGALASNKKFVKGIPIGEAYDYYPPQEGTTLGQIAKACRYNSIGHLDKEMVAYYPNGVKQTQIDYENGIPHGMRSLWDEEGNIIEEGSYKQGKMEGRFFQRLRDGREVICHYVDNVREGAYEVYHPPHPFFGKVKALEAIYVDNQLMGDMIEYNGAGVKTAITPYKQGIKEGKAHLFDTEGKLMATLTFVQDRREGEEIEYFPSGKVCRTVRYVADLKGGEEKGYFENGALALLAHYKEGKKEGLHQEWNREGVLVFEGEYQSGLKEGKFNKYFDNGSPKVLQTYLNDKLHGIKKSYDEKGGVKETFYQMGEIKRGK